MKKKDQKKLTKDQSLREIQKLKKDLFNMRFKKVNGQVQNVAEFSAKFDGHANCYIETGFGKGTLIDFNYEIEPTTGTYPIPKVGPFKLLKVTRMNHRGKLAFKWIYWNMLLKAREMFIGHDLQISGKDIEKKK